jgi:hypothetical protein
MDDLLRVVLVVFGLFYLAASAFAFRAVAMDSLLTNAIAALAARKPEADAAERFRHRWIIVSALLIGAGALSLVTLLASAPWLLAAATTASLVYICILAPRFVDPTDPAAAGGRAKSFLQTALIGTVSLLAFAADRQGVFAMPGDAPIRAVLAVSGFAMLCAYTVWILRKADLKRSRAGDDGLDVPSFDEPLVYRDTDPDALAALRIVLNPSWGRGCALDAETGEPLSWDVYRALLTETERDLLEDWIGLFVTVADPADPRRAALLAPDGVAQLDARGRPIFETVAARLGQDRVAFEPAPRPEPPRIAVEAVKVMADYECDALWFDGEDRVGCFSSADFGLSWRLACALSGWSVAFDEKLTEAGEPSSEGVWSEADAAAHAAEGRDLAHQLAAELVATGRAHVRVVYHPVGGAPETIAGGP